jgi:predicted anti-sigma-YlaC factor YlaD
MAEEHEKHAAECPEMKAIFLKVAQQYRCLADEIDEKIARQQRAATKTDQSPSDSD